MNTTETIVDLPRETYMSVCEEMKSLLQLEKEVAARKAIVREQVIEMSGGAHMENGINVVWRSSKGGIDYKAIAEAACSKVVLEKLKDEYKKPDREYWEVRSY